MTYEDMHAVHVLKAVAREGTKTKTNGREHGVASLTSMCNEQRTECSLPQSFYPEKLRASVAESHRFLFAQPDLLDSHKSDRVANGSRHTLWLLPKLLSHPRS